MPSVITEPEDIADSASAGRSGGHVASADVPRSTKGAAMKTARALSWRGRDRTFVLASLVDHPGRATGRAEISADPPRAGARGWGTGPGQERVRRGSDTPGRPGRDRSAARHDRAAVHQSRYGECRNARRSARPESPCPRPEARSSVLALLISSRHHRARRPRPAASHSSRALHPAIAGRCPGQARRDLMRPGLRPQGDAKCSDEPRDRGTDGDTARTRAASTAQTRPMFERSAVSVRAEYELQVSGGASD